MMRFVQQEKIKPLQQVHLSIDRMSGCFFKIRFREGKNTRHHFFACSEQVLHNLPARFAAIIMKQGVCFSRISRKRGIVFA